MLSCLQRCFIAALSCSVALGALVAAGSANAAGQLDPTFANGPTQAGALRGIKLAIAPDGRIAVSGSVVAGSFAEILEGAVFVFDADGNPYTTFGGAGYLTFAGARNSSLDAVTFDPAGRVLAGGANQFNPIGPWLKRILVEGSASTTFVPVGPVQSPTVPLGSVASIALTRSGLILAGGSTGPGGGFDPSQGTNIPVVVRLGKDGGFDPGFAAGAGYVQMPTQLPLTDNHVILATDDAQGRVLVVARYLRSCELFRLTADGAFDATFSAPNALPIVDCNGAARDGADRLVIATNANVRRFVDGRPDPTFGTNGTVTLVDPASAIAIASDNGVFVASAALANGQATVKVLRLREDGTVDTSYGSGGTASATFSGPMNFGIESPVVAADADDRAIVAILRFEPPAFGAIAGTLVHMFAFTGRAPAPAVTTAVEYYYARFDHYFLTAYAAEIAALDGGRFPGWVRTGESFQVFGRIASGRYPVCRFFSGQTFAPKSSHFYSPISFECDLLAHGSVWNLEALPFELVLPDGVGSGSGTCGQGLRALYRLYNNGQGGAPNHRYTMRTEIVDRMLGQGWVYEGEALTRVFACVPG